MFLVLWCLKTQRFGLVLDSVALRFHLQWFQGQEILCTGLKIWDPILVGILGLRSFAGSISVASQVLGGLLLVSRLVVVARRAGCVSD